MTKNHGLVYQGLSRLLRAVVAIALGVLAGGCSNGVEDNGETVPQPGGWSKSSAVAIGSPGDRWLDTMQFVRVARDTQDGQPGYAVTYDAPGVGAFTLFWSRRQIDFGRGSPPPLRSDVPISGGRLYVPDTITARSLPNEHQAIILLENSYAKDADGFIAATEGFMVVASMGPGPRLVRASLRGAAVRGAAVRTDVPVARVVATKYRSFTERNFRDNLIRFTGRQPKGAHAHHVLPRKHSKKFRAKGINIHDPRYGAWWPAKKHLSAAKGYNQMWDEFFDVPVKRSIEEIFQLGRELATQYGLQIYF